MKEAAQVAHWIATAVCWVAVVRSINNRWVFRAPGFVCYLIALASYWTVWSTTAHQFFLVEPVMMGLKIMIAAELGWLLIPYTTVRERRWMEGFLWALIALVIFWTRDLLPKRTDEVAAWFRAARHVTSLCLACYVGFGILYFWANPPSVPKWLKVHGQVIACFLVLKSILEFVPRAYYWTSNAVFFLASAALLVWWMLGQQRDGWWYVAGNERL